MVIQNFYMISLKDKSCGMEYGRNSFDFNEGVMIFTAPGQTYKAVKEIKSAIPEMVVISIQQANMEHRRQHLEHITQLGHAEHVVDSEFSVDVDRPQESTADADPSPE